MSITMRDYDRIVDRLAADLGAMGDRLLSVMLFGSVPQGTAIAGRSDIDAFVFLRDAAFRDRETFLFVLETMVKACRRFAASGAAYDHPFGYVTAEEVGPDLLVYLPSLLHHRGDRTVEEVRFVAGEDLCGTYAGEPGWESGLLTFLNWWVYPCAGLLSKTGLSAEDRAGIAGLLQSIRKFVPPVVCADAGFPAVADDAHRTLARLYPDLDVAVLDEITALKDAGEDLPCTEVLRSLLKRCFVLVEELHRRVRKGART